MTEPGKKTHTVTSCNAPLILFIMGINQIITVVGKESRGLINKGEIEENSFENECD